MIMVEARFRTSCHFVYIVPDNHSNWVVSEPVQRCDEHRAHAISVGKHHIGQEPVPCV
jgi:hypothetical protein